ncbi:MAG: tRNA lysidine(34) synthetase TilS [Thermoanaerobaculia bacterium]|nr:tRNA lysidine(34) synthetase TilS [Thermoanaerobaculia bacterium]
MGSSPVTATIGPSAVKLLQHLQEFLLRELSPRELAPNRSRTPPRLLVAFSGGPDSLALLWGLKTLAERWNSLTVADVGCNTAESDRSESVRASALAFDVEAAHFDHAMDPTSGARADAARSLASALGVPFWSERASPVGSPPQSAHQGREGEARRLRYDFLRQVAESRSADAILTAHHADDQVETVCLRMLFGSGIAGLAAMQPRQGNILRPLLEIRRGLVEEAIAELGLTFTEDPTNRDLALQRNLVRHRLLPALPTGTDLQVLRLADAASRARSTIERVLGQVVPWSPNEDGLPDPHSYPLSALSQLPSALLPWAMARLHRAEGHDYPPPQGAVRELQSQLDRRESLEASERPRRPLRCSAGASLLWEERQGSLYLAGPPAPIAPFTVTEEWPRTVALPRLGCRLQITREPIAEWMFCGAPRRTALSPDIDIGTTFTVRNRRPGDRVRPLGHGSLKRLKELFVNFKIPAAERDEVPLLCIEDSIAWVPGVTIGDEFKLLPRHREAWVVRLTTKGSVGQ